MFWVFRHSYLRKYCFTCMLYASNDASPSYLSHVNQTILISCLLISTISYVDDFHDLIWFVSNTDVLLTLTVWYIPTWGQNINSSSKNCFTKRLWKSLEPNNAFAQCKQYGVFFCTKITYKVRLHHLLFSKMNIIMKPFLHHRIHWYTRVVYSVYYIHFMVFVCNELLENLFNK